MNQLFIDNALDYNSDLIVGLSEAKLAELQISRDEEVVLIEGKQGKATVCMLQPDNNCPNGKIRMTRVVRNNLRVNLNDVVSVKACRDIQDAIEIYVVAIDDTVKGLTGNFFEAYLKPHFFYTPTGCPTHAGDPFVVCSGMRAVEFKVLHIFPLPYSYVRLTTKIYYQENPIKREKGEALNVVGYNNIGGVREQLAQIQEMVKSSLCHSSLLEAMGVKSPRGILLYGPSGTGKTLIVRAVANENGLSYFSITDAGIMRVLAGESENILCKIFEDAEKNSPAIIFIDKLDAIAQIREHAHGEVDRLILWKILALMDCMKQSSNVIVIAATNRPNIIDAVYRRSGRFDHEIHIGKPDVAQRGEILRILTNNINLADDVNLERIAAETDGYVGADLASLCTTAALTKVHEKINPIDFENVQVDAEVMVSLFVTMDHFTHAMTTRVIPSGHQVG